MSSALELLAKSGTIIVADSGEIEKIKQFKPRDITTNPSLILKAASLAEYRSFVTNAVEAAKKTGLSGDDLINYACDVLSVEFGLKLAELVEGYVSTEVDPTVAFDTEATLFRARRLIDMYKSVNPSIAARILIKLPATYESLKACEVLEAEGIKTNITLVFSLVQAVEAGNRGATLISPFVGRITDWYKAKTGSQSYEPEADPGVLSVEAIYNYYKKHGYPTIVMGASFRNIGQIIALAGCDRLTISPALLDELQKKTDTDVPVRLAAADAASKCNLAKLHYNESAFRWALNEDAMATEKLSEGIRLFAADLNKLKAFLAPFFN